VELAEQVDVTRGVDELVLGEVGGRAADGRGRGLPGHGHGPIAWRTIATAAASTTNTSTNTSTSTSTSSGRRGLHLLGVEPRPARKGPMLAMLLLLLLLPVAMMMLRILAACSQAADLAAHEPEAFLLRRGHHCHKPSAKGRADVVVVSA
jgi:hypothetical protein